MTKDEYLKRRSELEAALTKLSEEYWQQIFAAFEEAPTLGYTELAHQFGLSPSRMRQKILKGLEDGSLPKAAAYWEARRKAAGEQEDAEMAEFRARWSLQELSGPS